MRTTIAIMITATTYGTWMRGDRRGWIDKGVLKPQNETLEAHDRQRQQHEAFRFTKDQLLEIGAMMGKSLTERQRHKILALTIQTDHFHLLVGATFVDVPEIAKCAKEAVRYGLRLGRPIWTKGYDKRYCFDLQTLESRINYIEAHNTRMGWPAKPWNFICEYGD